MYLERRVLDRQGCWPDWGLLWLVLAFPLMFVMLILAALATPVAFIFGGMGIAALTVAAFLIVGPARHRLLLASTGLGLLFESLGAVAYLNSGKGSVVPTEAIVVFIALVLVATLASALGAWSS